jgi:hypothetical protein
MIEVESNMQGAVGILIDVIIEGGIAITEPKRWIQREKW